MIKKFEDFVLECYGNPVNEAFQSSKLREIIKQHGKPKSKYDIKYLYDIEDDNIVDVVDNSDEYYDKYIKGNGYGEENPYSSIPLEDGSVIVITGLKSYSKYKERHKGNLGKYGGDDIHHKHVNNVNKIETKRFAKKLQPHVSEIVDLIDKILGKIWKLNKTDGKYVNKIKIDGKDYEIVCECDGDSGWLETKIELDGNIYPINISLNVEMSNYRRSSGAEYYDLDVYLSGFEIYNNFDDDIYITNDDLDITEDTHDDLFSNGYLLSEDEEGQIFDIYARNGLRREDFH